MRKPPLGPTTPHRVLPCVLLVGIDSSLEPLCRQSAALAAGARLETCDMASVTTRAAELRPFALVVPSEILDFDPAEFVALARTVNAALIPLDSARASAPGARAELVKALRDAHQRRAT
ncbi:MAG: hypothetical protein IPM35_40760 [Myxococcales bacterium]|nr:hypothetical protein [Myxococcales bacterium]